MIRQESLEEVEVITGARDMDTRIPGALHSRIVLNNVVRLKRSVVSLICQR